MQGRTWKLLIPNWIPTPVNQLMSCHWATAGRRKAADKNLICAYCLTNRLPLAQGPRRVDLFLTLKGPGRPHDPDAFWKSLLDGLVHARMLIDDDRRYSKQGDVEIEYGAKRQTVIVLTDLYSEPGSEPCNG